MMGGLHLWLAGWGREEGLGRAGQVRMAGLWTSSPGDGVGRVLSEYLGILLPRPVAYC